MLFRWVFIVLIILCNDTVSACEITLRHIKAESEKDQRNHYFIDLLSLALGKTQEEGCFNLVPLVEPLPQARALKSLNKDYGVDIVWSMTSIERESEFLAIRIPLLKGLSGHRIFIIRQEDQDRFALIKNLPELQALVAGQGRDWPDNKILQANKIKVIEGGDYDGLFTMLNRKRFDYFPRGVNEARVEVIAHQDKELVIEKNLLLHYIAPTYYFVNKQNLSLAQRIEKGLLLAISDGSFDQLFKNHPSNKAIFDHVKINERHIIKLDNPFLPIDTPVDNEKFWYKP